MHIPSVTRRRQVIPLEIWRERFGLMIHLETAQIRAVTFLRIGRGGGREM